MVLLARFNNYVDIFKGLLFTCMVHGCINMFKSLFPLGFTRCFFYNILSYTVDVVHYVVLLMFSP